MAAVCAGAYPYVSRSGQVSYPFAAYEVDTALPFVAELRGRGQRLSCVRRKDTHARAVEPG